MTVSPTATTVLPCIVTESEVPGIVFPLVPTFWTKAIAARASELAGPASITRARSVRVRTLAPVRPITLVMPPPPPSTPRPTPALTRRPAGSAVRLRVSAEPSVCFSGHAGGAAPDDSRTPEIQGVGSARWRRLRRPLPPLRARGRAARALGRRRVRETPALTPAIPPSRVLVRDLFLRLLGGVFLVAFLSLLAQATLLFG